MFDLIVIYPDYFWCYFTCVMFVVEVFTCVICGVQWSLALNPGHTVVQCRHYQPMLLGMGQLDDVHFLSEANRQIAHLKWFDFTEKNNYIYLSLTKGIFQTVEVGGVVCELIFLVCFQPFTDGDYCSFLFFFEIERMIERKRRLNTRYP